MKFNKLNEWIPKVPADKDNLHKHTIYVSGGYDWSVRVKWPGKHVDSAGDFVVETLSKPTWERHHQFTHVDLFNDVMLKFESSPAIIADWLSYVLPMVDGDTHPARLCPLECDLPGVHLDALTASLLPLVVCEYRRYPQGDVRGGGRYLPINYLLSILQGYWTPAEAARKMRKGFPPLRELDGFVPYRRAVDAETYLRDYRLDF